jgi:hypothetical protein
MMFPYRWTYGTIFKNISSGFRSITHGIRNIVIWTPVIWDDHDWDWAYLAKIMEFKFRKMSHCFKYHGNSVNCEKDAKNLLICAELLKRLRDDDFVGEDYRKHENQMTECQRLLGKMIGKYLRSWWD